MELKISYKTFVQFYRNILTINEGRDRAWFYSDLNSKFKIIIPEGSLILVVNITYEEIVNDSPDKEKLDSDEIIQKWKEENLINAIPFEEDIVQIFTNEENIIPLGDTDDGVPIN